METKIREQKTCPVSSLPITTNSLEELPHRDQCHKSPCSPALPLFDMTPSTLDTDIRH